MFRNDSRFDRLNECLLSWIGKYLKLYRNSFYDRLKDTLGDDIEIIFEKKLKTTEINSKIEDIESSLLYLSKVNALEIDGNFLVFYNSLQIKRLQLDNRQKYTKEKAVHL